MAKDLIEEMYISKETDYFSLEREVFKKAITENNLNVLDVGCGTGVLGAFLIKNQKCKVFGVEINEDAFNAAKTNLTDVIKGNIETMDLPYNDDFFDVVVMGDVLEHLINPIGTINKLIEKLKPTGRILITVPNIRYWKTLSDLVFKDLWDYQSWGILDYTHLRFYTKTSIIKMIQNKDIKVIDAKRVIQKPSKSDKINRFSFGFFEGILASHTFLILQK